jgi:hypothetical protein
MAIKAVTSNIASIRLSFGEAGTEILKSISIGSIIPNADLDQVTAVADAIASLLSGTYANARFTETSSVATE